MDPDPKVLEVCYLCGVVHDETLGGWFSERAYRESTGIDPFTCCLTHTYCPDCYAYCLGKISKAA
jgi:hypothetical protein